jgi:hypothetical protein
MDAEDIRLDPRTLAGKYADSDTLSKVLQVISTDLVSGGGGGGGGTVSVNVGDTTTVAPGTPALVANSGTATAVILDFSIPAGFNGAKGDQGIQGLPGAKGDKGDTGATGAKGDKGDTGIGAIDGIDTYTWTGTQAINTLASLNLTSLVAKGITELNSTLAGTGAATAIKVASREARTHLALRIRVTGTVSGSTGTDRFFQAQIRRASDGSVVDNITVPKASGTNNANTSVCFNTWYKGATDPYVASGLQVFLVNGDDSTLTITSVDFTIFGTVITP